MYVGKAPQFIACISFQRVDNDRSKTFKHGITAAVSRYYNIMNGQPRGGGGGGGAAVGRASRSTPFCEFFLQHKV